jgi:hypothetical protein
MIKVVSPSWRGQLRISSPMIKAEREFFACALGTLTSRPPVVTRSMVARESVRAGPTNRQESAKIPRRIKMMRLKFGEWNRTILKFGLSLECATPKIFSGSFPNRLQLTQFCPNELRKQRRDHDPHPKPKQGCDKYDLAEQENAIQTLRTLRDHFYFPEAMMRVPNDCCCLTRGKISSILREQRLQPSFFN